MFVLSRRTGGKIVIGDGIVVIVMEVHRDSARLGVDAPRSVPVNRAELVKTVPEENMAMVSIDAVILVSLRSIRPAVASPLDLHKLVQKSALTQGAAVSTDGPGDSDSAVPLGDLSSAVPDTVVGALTPSAVPGLPAAKPAAGTPGLTIPKLRPILKPRDLREQQGTPAASLLRGYSITWYQSGYVWQGFFTVGIFSSVEWLASSKEVRSSLRARAVVPMQLASR